MTIRSTTPATGLTRFFVNARRVLHHGFGRAQPDVALAFLAFGYAFQFAAKLQQEPDPSPPFRLIVCAAYGPVLALSLRSLLSRKTHARVIRHPQPG